MALVGYARVSSVGQSLDVQLEKLKHCDIVPLTVADLPDKGIGWRVYPALFARAGATLAARKALTEAAGIVVDLPRLFADLTEV